MRKLFKNSFKSFLSSKLAMILLSLTIFLSIAVFTMLSSTSWAFDASYNQVVKNGQLHDFTINEKYTIQGQSGIGLKVTENGESYYQLTDGNPNNKRKGYETLNNDFRDLFKVTRTDVKTKTSTVIKPAFKINFLDSEKFGIDPTTKNIKTMKNGFEMNISSGDSVLGVKTQTYMPKIITINNKIQANTVINKFEINGFEYEITPLKSYSDIESTLINKVVIPEKLVSPKTPVNISWNIDWNKMSADYRNMLKISTDQTKNENLVRNIIQAYGIDDVNIIWGDIGTKNFDITKLDLIEQKDVKKITNSAETAIDEYIAKSRTNFFVNETRKKYGQYIAKDGIKNIESIYINSGKQQFKIVDTKDNKETVDKLVLFKGNAPENSLDTKDMIDKFKIFLKQKFPKFKDEQIQSSKEYKVVFDNNLGGSASFIDPSSFQAVITDGYAKEHNIEPISKSKLQEFNKEVLKYGIDVPKIDALFKDKRFSKYVQYIDSTPYIITGIGTTPDFSFPIINQQNPLPNSKTQAILFTNDHGYKRIEDAFRGNQKENYLAYRFKDGITDKQKKMVLAGITQITREPSMMSWPNNVNPVSTTFDTNEKIILAPQRIAFLDKLKRSITTITFLTTSLLAVLTAFIILMVIKKQISAKRKTLGTLLANGYTKNQIAWSMTTIALIIIIVPSMLGYIVGHFMQSVFINMFTNYWTLPIYNDSFSLVTLFLVMALPCVIVVIFAYVASRISLKDNLIEILNSSQSKSAGWLTSKALKPFGWLGVKSKITISLFTSNMSKMALVFITTAITMVAGGVAFSIMGRFNYALNTSKSKVNYTFKVDMASPTYEGGLLSRVNPDEFGMKEGETWGKVSDPQEIFKEGLRHDFAKNKSYFHIPGKNDNNERWELNYLKNRMQFKSMLNFNVLGGVNPWKTALSLMPENQRNIANKQEKKFIKTLIEWSNTPEGQKALKGDLVKINNFTIAARQNDYEFNETQINSNNMNAYKRFIFEGLKEQIRRYDTKLPYAFPYFISYNNVTTDNDDELYTHIDIDYEGKNLLGQKETINTTITGINPDTKMIKFDDGLLDRFKQFKYDVTRDNEQVVPIIINTYFEETYGVSEGDVIDFTIKNRADRKHTTQTATGKGIVIGIQESYDGPKLYTTQSIANSKLGWVDPISNKKAFNGVYTKSEDPMIFKNISLYSISGFYPGTDTIDKNANVELTQNISNRVSQGYKNQRVANLASYRNIYGNSPYISTFSSANWAAMSNYAFTNTLDLSGKLIWMVEGIAIFIAILFVAIIASMIISDNKKFISTMKVLGYRNREIRKMFFRSLMPAIILGLIVAIPITIVVLLMMKAIIISFGAILVPVGMMGWELILTFFLITFAFSIIYYFAMRKLGNEEMLEAFKE
ncbi:ABC transporter permease [Mycoplasma marinum]|uniref:ABC3 transporter permease C-terminal domain-containing protein n=1 Tax=Mycoplasma marinum TaxID=1937190 RepID=A0A4R0XPR8_9MOLU|nr:FtsX-like permease family protein [Mycoplasma marinum]TCG10875.1 hypothetical protein C4B24_03625 [Mycoplasma marinum]